MHLFIDLVQALAGLVAAIGASVGLFVGLVRIVPRLIDNGMTMLELKHTREQLETAKQTAENNRIAAESWQLRVEAMTESINELKAELAAAVVYIVELIVFLKEDGRSEHTPPIPDNLQHLIDEGLRQRGEAPHHSGGTAA